jgi:hypothetical protein
MHKEKLKNVKLEQQLNSTTNADVTTSSPNIGNTLVGCSFFSNSNSVYYV